MSEHDVSGPVTKATDRTDAADRCAWGHGWPFDDHGDGSAEPCPNEADLEISIGRRGQTEVRVCGEHFMATAALMHKEWAIIAAMRDGA